MSPSPFQSSNDSFGYALESVNQFNRLWAHQLISVLQLERTRLSSGVSRESNIIVLGFFLAGALLLVSPLLSVLVLPALFYGLYTYRLDRKALKQVNASLKAANDIITSEIIQDSTFE
jgi:hypothetical protein